MLPGKNLTRLGLTQMIELNLELLNLYGAHTLNHHFKFKFLFFPVVSIFF